MRLPVRYELSLWMHRWTVDALWSPGTPAKGKPGAWVHAGLDRVMLRLVLVLVLVLPVEVIQALRVGGPA